MFYSFNLLLIIFSQLETCTSIAPSAIDVDMFKYVQHVILPKVSYLETHMLLCY